MNKIKPFLPAIISGFLIGTSFIPFPPWASFFAFVPLWLSWENDTSYKKIFLKGWITQFLLTLIGFYWVVVVAQEHGHLNYMVSVIALLLFSAIAMYYIPLAGVIWHYLRQKLNLKPISSFFLLALITALLERFYLTIFPWNFGYTFLWSKIPMFQLGEYIGFTGLSALCILLNAYFIAIYKAGKIKKGFIAFGIFFALINVTGILISKNIKEPDSKLNTLVVQANIGNLEKEMAQRGRGFIGQIISQYISLSNEAIQSYENESPIDFMIWPETAIPISVRVGQSFDPRQKKVRLFLSENNLPLFSGGYYTNPKSRRISNGFFVFDNKGQVNSTPYRKFHLLAFGEYLPFSQTFPKLLEWFPEVAGFQPGYAPHVLNYKDYVVGPQICYEALYPDITKSLSDQGAQFIVNLTNDSWYGPNSEPYQHLFITLARAVEFRRPVIRSTNTGVSTAMLANGEQLTASPLYTQWTHVFKVPYVKNPQPTFYQRFFYLIEVILALLLCIFITKGLKNKNE